MDVRLLTDAASLPETGPWLPDTGGSVRASLVSFPSFSHHVLHCCRRRSHRLRCRLLVGPSGAFPVGQCCLSTGGYERMEASGARATRPTATNSRHPGSQMGLGKKGRDPHHLGHRSRLKPVWLSPPLSGCTCALQRRRTPRGLQARAACWEKSEWPDSLHLRGLLFGTTFPTGQWAGFCAGGVLHTERSAHAPWLRGPQSLALEAADKEGRHTGGWSVSWRLRVSDVS